VNGNGRGYSWLPDLNINKVTPPGLPLAYIEYINNIAFNKGDSKGVYNGSVAFVALSFEKGSRNETLFHIANSLAKGGMPEGEALQTLARVGSTCKPPLATDEIQSIVSSAFKRREHREINLTKEIEDYIEATNGDFSATECYNILQGATNGDTLTINRRSVKDILRRIWKTTGRIQKVGNRDGVYRRVDEVAEEIDWLNASTEPLPIKFPLKVEEYAAIYPKNIIVIAGEPNAGKTAFMMNLAIMNARSQKISYFSSEMGAIELKTRISRFDISLDQWKAIKFKERCGNFADVIDPDGLTIIDFLEITDDFYKIAAFIKELYDKLNTGICIIGIQKSRGKDIGRGGELGLEKPRLYLAMEPGKIKIIKAKAWAKEGVNPNGLQREFKLVQGAKFIEETPWHKQGEM
jgi:hypothetical protein